MPFSLAQLYLDLIHSEADASQVPVPAVMVGDDALAKFWRGLMMCEQLDETSESSSRLTNIVMKPPTLVRMQ